MKRPYLLLFLFLFTSIFLNAQLTIQLTKIPSNTPLGDSIFLVGNMNNWNAGDPNYQLLKNSDNLYAITINPSIGELKFKFTRGDWSRVEGDENGGFRPDRIFNYDGTPTTINLSILSWEGQSNGNSTAAANVSILDNNFLIPQLNRNRRIWLYLPPDYSTSNKKYPVLYMHDGQNLFDDATSFSGEWKVDESLNELFAQGDYGVIVVGIDNGGANRADEYLPWSHPNYGGGNGGAYIDFIAETLKPYIDQNYRTYTEQEYTGIMGSSLGGLISCYAAIEHQEVFGKAGCFSSSFWLYEDPYLHVKNTGKKENLKVYFIAGQKEDDNIDVPADMYRMQQTFYDAGFSNSEIQATDHVDGTHSEWYWAREFSAAYQWLFGDLILANPPEDLRVNYQFNIYPNPGSDFLIIEKENDFSGLTFELYDLQGKLILQKAIANRSNKIALPELPSATYLINILDRGKMIFSEQWMMR